MSAILKFLNISHSTLTIIIILIVGLAWYILGLKVIVNFNDVVIFQVGYTHEDRIKNDKIKE